MKVLVVNMSPVKNGATAEMAATVSNCLMSRHEVRSVCIDDYSFSFCKGCRSCHSTAKCVLKDDVGRLISCYQWADLIIPVSPSYWADIAGQFKAFIDRCTPWCNTHEPHASIGQGKKGWAIVQRTGPNMKECDRLLETIRHFYGHMEIEYCGGLGLCRVENREDAAERREEIEAFCGLIP